jgi:hypothetical protein
MWYLLSLYSEYIFYPAVPSIVNLKWTTFSSFFSFLNFKVSICDSDHTHITPVSYKNIRKYRIGKISGIRINILTSGIKLKSMLLFFEPIVRRLFDLFQVLNYRMYKLYLAM